MASSLLATCLLAFLLLPSSRLAATQFVQDYERVFTPLGDVEYY
jgi:hypothetical protein